jgi:pilus assembly protein CpaE
VDAIADRESGLAVLPMLARACPGLPLIAVLRANDSELNLHCLRLGAADFLTRPFTTEQLNAVLGRIGRVSPEPAQAPPFAASGRVCSILPAKGASGATTLAWNLALAFRRGSPGKVLLADLDGLSGTIPFLLKLKHGYSYLDALSNSASLDAELWKSLVTSAAGVDVILSPDNPVDSFGAAGDPAPLLDYARGVYDWIIVDTGGVFGEWNVAVTKSADILLMVTNNDLPALHAAQRALAYLGRSGVNRDRVRVVLNRFQKNLGLDPDDIETALGQSVFETVPDDSDVVLKALMEGKGVGASTRFGKAVAALANRLLDLNS